MRRDTLGVEVRRRLLREGFERGYANRTARELQEHWDEIVDELVAGGASEPEATDEASRRLGAAEIIAEELCARMRDSSWLGRNPTFGFLMVALTITCAWWVLLGSAAAGTNGFFSKPIAQGGTGPNVDGFRAWIDWIRGASYIAVPWLCCLIAERFFCGWRPALWACLVIAIHNATHFFKVSGGPNSGTVEWGYGFRWPSMPSLLAVLTPLAVFALYHLWRVRQENGRDDSGPKFC